MGLMKSRGFTVEGLPISAGFFVLPKYSQYLLSDRGRPYAANDSCIIYCWNRAIPFQRS